MRYTNFDSDWFPRIVHATSDFYEIEENSASIDMKTWTAVLVYLDSKYIGLSQRFKNTTTRTCFSNKFGFIGLQL